MEYILVQDNDSHWFVIPADREQDFDKWCSLDPDTEASWEQPPYADDVGGSPTLVKFKEYVIE